MRGRKSFRGGSGGVGAGLRVLDRVTVSSKRACSSERSSFFLERAEEDEEDDAGLLLAGGVCLLLRSRVTTIRSVLSLRLCLVIVSGGIGVAVLLFSAVAWCVMCASPLKDNDLASSAQEHKK